MFSAFDLVNRLSGWRHTISACAALIATAHSPVSAASSPVFQVLHEFNGQDTVVVGPGGHGPSSDGNTPYGRLLRAADGTLYATTCRGGVWHSGGIFSFSPPAPSHRSWTEKTIYSLGGTALNDGFCAVGGLISNGGRGLYGTAIEGGPYVKSGLADPAGMVFELTPPPSGKGDWQERVIYAFKEKRLGWEPNTTLLRDRTGALYGLLAAGGAHGSGGIYKLTPPATGGTAWTETLIYSFTKSVGNYETIDAPLIMDSAGALYSRAPEYGADHNGAIIKLTPPTVAGGAWTMSVLYKFVGGADGAEPLGGVIFGPKGTLLGTTWTGGHNNSGTIFSLTPPKAGNTTWTHTILYTFPGNNGFGGPIASLVRGRGGVLYSTDTGSSSGIGSLFELVPTAAGTTGWTANILHHFTQQHDGGNPVSGPVVDANGVLYGAASAGGKYEGGTLYQITP